MDINQLLKPWNTLPTIKYNPVIFNNVSDNTIPESADLEYMPEKPKETSEEKKVEEAPKLTIMGDIYGFNGWDFTNISKHSKEQPIKKVIPIKSEWVNQLSLVYRSMGLPENAIKNLISKNALESNWGKSTQGHYNYGNITTGKYWKGDYVNGKDHNALGKSIQLKFRSYKDMKDYAKDEILFLTRLYNFNPNDDFKTFANKLLGQNSGKRRYAEDRKYLDKITKVYNNLS